MTRVRGGRLRTLGRVLRKGLEIVVVIVLATFGTAALARFLPGGPAAAILGPGHPAEQYDALNDRLGANDPLLTQYLSWVSHALRGDLGTSWSPPGGSVVSRIGRALPVSLELVVLGVLIALVTAAALALVSAAKPNGILDRAISATSFAFIAVPSFVTGLVLILALAMTLPVFPRGDWVPLQDGVFGNLQHALLPAIVVAMSEIPVLTMLMRSDLLTTLDQDFIASARARGMSRWHILRTDALRPSSFSVLTLAGTSFATAIGSTVIVEVLFGLPGLGSMVVTAATSKDIPLLQGTVSVIALLVVLVNALIDASYSWLDPRVRRGAA